MFGKPETFVSLSGVENGSYAMNQLSNLSASELVSLIENFESDTKNSAAFRKILERIMQDKMENEYNRTKIEDRRGVLENALKKEKFQMNVKGNLRIIETLDGASHVKRNSYVNQKLRDN